MFYWEQNSPWLIEIYWVWLKGLITVGRELRQQHASDLLSGAGISRERSSDNDYNMTKQLCINRIYDKISSKLPPNRGTSPTCFHCDVTHLSLTTGVVALHIPSWRAGVRGERRLALKTVWPVHAGRVIYRYQNNYLESSITRNIYDIIFWRYKSQI